MATEEQNNIITVAMLDNVEPEQPVPVPPTELLQNGDILQQDCPCCYKGNLFSKYQSIYFGQVLQN